MFHQERVALFPESEVCGIVVLARTLFFLGCLFQAHELLPWNGMSAFTPWVHPIIQLSD